MATNESETAKEPGNQAPNTSDADESKGSATGQTHSEIGAHGGGSPGADAAAAKRQRTGEDATLSPTLARGTADPSRERGTKSIA